MVEALYGIACPDAVWHLRWMRLGHSLRRRRRVAFKLTTFASLNGMPRNLFGVELIGRRRRSFGSTIGPSNGLSTLAMR